MAFHLATAERALSAPARSFSSRYVSFLVGICDGAVVLAACLLVFVSHIGWTHETYPVYLLAAAIFTGFTMTVFYSVGLFTLDAIETPHQQVNKIILSSLVAFATLAGSTLLHETAIQFSAVWAFASWGFSVSLICITRLCAYHFARRWVQSAEDAHGSVLAKYRQDAPHRAYNAKARLDGLACPVIRSVENHRDDVRSTPDEEATVAHAYVPLPKAEV